MNVLIAINENYIEPAKTMLYSLAYHQTEHTVVYLLQSTIRKERLDEFRTFLERKCHAMLEIVPVDPSLFADVPKQKWLSEETYYRLIAFELLPESVDRVLWLDADIIVKGNISEFYYAGFEGQYAVVCAEGSTQHHVRLGLSESHRYFNAGVVLYNMALIRKYLTIRDVFECIELHKSHLDLMDQDILNVMFENHVKYMDADEYNHGAFGFNVLTKGQMLAIRDNAKIIHYKGSKKPWNPKGANWADGYWWKYEQARGGRNIAAICYKVLHAPVKVWHILREVYYFVYGQLQSLQK